MHHHCWVFSGAIEQVHGEPGNGEIVALHDFQQNFLAYGSYNPVSKISVRVLEWDQDTLVDEQWWDTKIREAIARRSHFAGKPETDSYRIIHSEADLIPGLIADKYADYIVVQFLTSGTDLRKEIITASLQKYMNPKGIYERSDSNSRSLEGLAVSNGLLYGEMPPEQLEIRENNIRFRVNISDGQKSGYFLDQRENRKLVAGHVKGKQVLDCFCYSGGFSLYAQQAGAASVTSVDSSAPAIQTVAANYEANQLQANPEQLIEADVFDFLRKAQAQQKHWDVIILDPPKLSPSRQAVERAQRAYKDLNMQAMKLMKPGDLLATFSCSGSITLDHFKQIIAWAATDARKELQIIQTFGQPEDHPIRTSFPESEYLKGVLCQVI